MKERSESKIEIKGTILIAGGGAAERDMLGQMLCDQYRVLFAENDAAAFEMIRSDRYGVSLVILRLPLPEPDGYRLLEAIREDAELWHIPVIVLSSEKESEIRCLKMGAADFIGTPPTAPEVVCARVDRAIRLAEDSVILRESKRDEQTGLLNKKFFFEYGKRWDRYHHGIPMDAVVLDINRFHVLNELYGKEYGDGMLKKIVDTIREMTKSARGIACRSGSNGFYIYIPHVDDLKIRIGEYIRGLENTIGDHKLSVRIGIYKDEGKYLDIEQKFDRAKIACESLKNTYETAYAFYDDALRRKELYAERLKNDVEEALAKNEFRVMYQPQYDVSGKEPVIVGAEALIRWNHPEYGSVEPSEFIPLLENSGMIYKLDRYVWREAAQKVREWQDELGAELSVSVNVSRVDLYHPKIKEELDDILRQNGLSHDRLVLEVTESAYTDKQGGIIDQLKELQRAGYKIEMDDFGSGYSSLNMLTSMPLDAIKLDREFVKNICTDQKRKELVGSMIGIAKLLEAPRIAEGVETKEEMEILKALGCNVIQGYYFGKPLEPDELTARLIR